MRIPVTAPVRYDLRALHAHLTAAGLPGFAGLSTEGAALFAVFEEGTTPAPEDETTLATAVAAYAYVPTWDAVRRARVPLLAEADWRIQRAEDQGEDATALRSYRQALRDVTTGDDPDSPAWPPAPWQN
jgi:hypothetical protein